MFGHSIFELAVNLPMILESFLSSVRRTVLPNGLTVLTREKAGGVVAINTWVKAGYFHEPDEVAGMAHLFEHMFFKGSGKFPGSEEIAQHVSRLGGMTNAGTIYDSTNYYFVLPKEGFQRGVEIQADAIANPLFDPDELKKEAEVVIEESNRKLDNPAALATERMFATAYTDHRFRRWRIGSNEVLRNIRRDDLVAFFETLYRPENIIVTVVGDVSHHEAFDAISRTFGELPVGSFRKLRGPSEPRQTEFRYGESFADIEQAYTVFGWQTPGEGDESELALDLLSTILGAGRSSRLFRSVIAPDAASSVTASHSTWEDVGIFSIRASADDSKIEEVEKRIIHELVRLARFGPTTYECDLAKNQIESSLLFELEDVLGQTQILTHFESRGAYSDVGTHLERLRLLTPERLREIGARFLENDVMTLYRYRPLDAARSTREAVEPALTRAAGEEVAEPRHLPIPEIEPFEEGAPAELPPQRYVLSNGIPLFVQQSPSAPTVSVAISFRGGRVREHSRNAGITQLMARSMRRGTTSRTGEQIDREIEFLGTRLSIAVDPDDFSFGFTVVRRYLPAALSIVSDVILHPAFPDDGIDEERHLQIAAIRRSHDSASDRPFELFFNLFYGNHPYAIPDAGFIDSIEPLTSGEIREWHERHLVADRALIVVVGDVEGGSIFEQFEREFSSMRKSVELERALPLFVPSRSRREIVELRDRKQSAIVIGFPTTPTKHPDSIPLRLLRDVTSGLAGTFFVELRAKRSLAYTVSAGDSPRELAGVFLAYIATEAAKEGEARDALLSEMRRLATDGITAADLDRAKSYAAGSTKIRLQTNAAIASEITRNVRSGRGLDFTERFLAQVRALTLEELKGVAARYLAGDNETVAILRGKG